MGFSGGAHAGWVGAHLRHLRFQFLHLKKTVLSLTDNQILFFVLC